MAFLWKSCVPGRWPGSVAQPPGDTTRNQISEQDEVSDLYCATGLILLFPQCRAWKRGAQSLDARSPLPGVPPPFSEVVQALWSGGHLAA
eukprot:709294-Rhodomonas_salina.1